jgi:hypothetical protein
MTREDITHVFDIFLWVSPVLLLFFLANGGGRLLKLWALEPVGVFAPTIACLTFLAVPQMAQMMIGMKGGYGSGGFDEHVYHQFGLAFGVFVLGLQSWFWTTAARNARYDWHDNSVPRNIAWQLLWAPRLTLVPTTIIAISPIIMAIRGAIPVHSVPWYGVWSSVFVSAFLVGLATYRRSRILKQAAASSARLNQSWRVAKLFEAAPYGPIAAGFMLLLGVVGMGIAWKYPDWVNDNLHTPTASLIALGCLVAVASCLLSLLRDLSSVFLAILSLVRKVPFFAKNGTADVLGLLLLVALPFVGSALADHWGQYNVPALPLPKDTDRELTYRRPDIQAAFNSYKDCHGSDYKHPVIVAAEGGASRSAAFTLAVMRTLDVSTDGEFGSHIFAITSVSGGSLAAVTYAMALSNFDLPGQATKADMIRFWGLNSVHDGMLELARGDLLSSTMARLFSVDMLTGFPTRADALEKAFEHNWRWQKGFDLKEHSVEPFLDVTRNRCAPHLLLNGTNVSTGDRLITSSIEFGAIKYVSGTFDAEAHSRNPFAFAVDVIHETGRDVPVSAAVLNSARFPMISPPGRLISHDDLRSDVERKARADDPRIAKQNDNPTIIDGGVFENYGALTAWELAESIKAYFPEVEPVIIVISNDVDLTKENTPILRCDYINNQLDYKFQPPENPDSGARVPEILTSLFGLYNTRAAHSRAEFPIFTNQLCKGVFPVQAAIPTTPPEEPTGNFFQFDLPRPEDSDSAPMNWVLDPNSCRYILNSAKDVGVGVYKEAEMKRLRALLKVPKEPFPDVEEVQKIQLDGEICDKPTKRVPAIVATGH